MPEPRVAAGRYGPICREVGEPDYCCRKMEEAWGIHVAFNPEGGRVTNVHLLVKRVLSTDESVVCPEPIAFCPFCGEAIQAVEVEPNA